MKTTEAEARVNGVHLTEITITAKLELNQTPPEMTATYALVEYHVRDQKHPDGRKFTHGKCTAYRWNWSKGTLELLEQLMSSMESDLLPRHFVEETEGRHASRIGPNEDESADQI